MKFAINDIVQKVTGGPLMVVCRIYKRGVLCKWFVEDSLNEQLFPRWLLKRLGNKFEGIKRVK